MRADLEKAGKLDSYVGQSAVTIAAKLESAGPGQSAGLTRELDRLMGLALGVQTSPPPTPDDDDASHVDEQEDEISAARRRAHAKMQQMAAGE